jgi:glutathione synthase/RimK-type ligase-like ATP-grasp enzyme
MTGLLLSALPDGGRVPVRADRMGRPVTAWENRVNLPEATGRWLSEAARTVWAGGVPALPGADWAVTLLAEPETYAAGLSWLDARLPAGMAVFNHPRAVALTRRDRSAARLAGVPGLVVPATHRFTPRTAADFATAFETGGFRFPVLVRPTGQQGGTGLLRIDDPAGWETAAATPWLGTPHAMTQFEDFATPTGTYFKARVLFVGGRAFPRHVKASTHWKVHNRGEGRVADTDELPIIDRLEDCAVFRGLCEGIAERLCLDFCGLDLGVDPDRQRYVLFEANPAMAVFFPERPGASAADRARRARLQMPAARALDALLRSPLEWASARGRTADLPPVAETLRD